MENEIKFILNYSTDNREIRSILKENRIFGNLCSSIRVNGGEFTFAKFINKDLEDIKNLSLSNRNFNIKGLTEGDIGVLKEKSEEETILYKIKVTRLYDSSFSNGRAGFLLSNKKLYTCNSFQKPQEIELNSVDVISVPPKSFNAFINVNNIQINTSMLNKKKTEVICNFLQKAIPIAMQIEVK